MTSTCSRWSQPPKAAINNWNGSAVGAYAIASLELWDTTRSQLFESQTC